MAALVAVRRSRPRGRHHRRPGRREVDHHLGARLRAAPRPDRRVGVLAVDPSSPFSGGALLGDRVRMGEHAARPGRLHPLDGLARAPRRARLGDAPGAAGPRRRRLSTSSWSRRSGSGRARSRWPRSPTPPLVLLAPGMGDGIQAAKAGILEIGDVYVVNKADREGADAARAASCATMLSLAERAGRRLAPGRSHGGLRRRGCARPRRGRRRPPRLAERVRGAAGRRTRRAREEVEAIAVAVAARPLGRRPAAPWTGRLAEAVAAGDLDPYAAADRLLRLGRPDREPGSRAPPHRGGGRLLGKWRPMSRHARRRPR